MEWLLRRILCFIMMKLQQDEITSKYRMYMVGRYTEAHRGTQAGSTHSV